MRETPKQLREQAAVLTCRLFAELYGDQNAHKACVYWADTFLEVARYLRIKAIPQAGSAQWQVNDGKAHEAEDTSFAYAFNPVISLVTRSTNMPEMHCWCVVPTDKLTSRGRPLYEIVDMSTGYQQQQALEMGHKVRWQFPPPEYLWMSEERLEIHCRMRHLVYEYHADALACHILHKYIALVRTRDRITYREPESILKVSAAEWLHDAGLNPLPDYPGAQG